MSIIRLTKEFSFEMAHTLEGYDGACSQIHGHSYRLYVTVIGTPRSDESDPKNGMVMDFGVLKSIVGRTIVDRYDHTLVIRRTQANSSLVDNLTGHYQRIEVVDYQPTCEIMIARFAEMLMSELPAEVKLHSLKMHETATSFAEWYRCDNGAE